MSWFKHKVIHQKMKDVFFNSRRKIIDLKNDERWLIDISPSHIKLIFLHDYAFICYGLILIFSIITLFSSHKTKAETATFYPSSCLGGWINPDNASGKEDLPNGSDSTLFNSDNSAVLQDSNGEIYCGGFTGEIPTGTEPKNFYLSFSWSINKSVAVPPPDSTSTTPAILPPATDTPPASNSPISVPPSDTPIPDNSPQSFLLSPFANIAYAQDTMISGTEVPTQITDSPTTDSPPLPLVPDATTLLNNATNVTPVEPSPENNFLIISYTLDGTTWMPLGEVSNSNWDGAKFLVPLSSWDDISKMQISIKSIPSIDKLPTVYLDAMRIDVEYEKMEGNISPSQYHISKMKSNTEGFNLSLGGSSPEREDILIKSDSPLSDVVVYDTNSGELIMNTNVNDLFYNLDAEYFGIGDFTVINTKNENMCDSLNLDGCLSDSSTQGSGTFSIVSKNVPQSQ